MRFEFPDFQLIPYTRFTQRGKWVVPKAQKYLDNQAALAWGYKATMLEKGWSILPPRAPLYIKWSVTRTGSLYQCDMDNLLKALIDGAQHVVFEDDRYIVKDLGGEKKQGSAALVVVTFGLVAEL